MENIDTIKKSILRKFPLLGATMANLTFKPSEDLQTAATNGTEVLYNEQFVTGLSQGEKVFLFSHEIMHVAFDHILRSKDKDPYIWNLATDAVINQMLINENLPMINGGVDIKEAINKSAEEMYEKLLKEKQNQNQEQNQQGSGNQNQNGQNQQAGHDEHDLWKEVLKQVEQQMQDSQNGNQQESQQGQQTQNAKQQSQNQTSQHQNNIDDFEKQFSKTNKEIKNEIGKQILERLNQEKQQGVGHGVGNQSFNMGEVGEAKSVLSWKRILKREFEKRRRMWSDRRADPSNDFQIRIEKINFNEHPITEVLLDTSGSISGHLLKNFLKQLKPLLKESKIKVGCFDTAFYGFEEIKTKKDIDNLRLHGRGGTSFDLALKSFTKDKKINKIIFTDGEDYVTENEFNKKMNVIWIVFDNKNFKPCCGKVINVTSAEINSHFVKNDDEECCF